MKGRRDAELPPVEEAAVEELARRVVRQVAPEEGEIFDVVRDAYRRDPQRLSARAVAVTGCSASVSRRLPRF